MWFVLSACGCEAEDEKVVGERGERERFFGCLTFWGFGHPSLAFVELSPLSCGAVLLERGCVLLGVRFSSAMLVCCVRRLGVSLIERSLNKAFL